jgi:SIR2-like domain
VRAKRSTRTILFGAGASVAAGVPTATEMVPRLCNLIRGGNHSGWRVFGDVVNAVIGGLQWYRSSVRSNPFGAIDVEDMYAMLCALRDRHSLPIAPFVGSWIPAISIPQTDIKALTRDAVEALAHDLSDYVRDGANKMHDIGRLPSSAPGLTRFQRHLDALVHVTSGRDAEVFERAIEAVLEALNSICTIEDAAKVAYLSPLMQSASSRPLWIATLNYDRSVEMSAAATGIRCDVGIGADGVVEFDRKSPVRLAKLHGSVDWVMDGAWNIEVGEARRPGQTALIFGSGNKLRVEGPYLDLLLAFREQLAATQELEICGYSFRDPHVNHLILRWLIQNSDRRVRVFDKFLAIGQIEQNIHDALNGERALAEGWLRSCISVENVTVEDWAAGAASLA